MTVMYLYFCCCVPPPPPPCQSIHIQVWFSGIGITHHFQIFQWILKISMTVCTRLRNKPKHLEIKQDPHTRGYLGPLHLVSKHRLEYKQVCTPSMGFISVVSSRQVHMNSHLHSLHSHRKAFLGYGPKVAILYLKV